MQFAFFERLCNLQYISAGLLPIHLLLSLCFYSGLFLTYSFFSTNNPSYVVN